MEHAAKLEIDASAALRKIRSSWLVRVIHDFRGPIFAARGYTKLLLDNKAGDVTATQREYLTQAIQNINKLSDLVNTLQEFPSDEALHLERVNFSELLTCACEQYQHRAETLQITYILPSYSVITIADSAKVMVAVHNLLGLAVDFSRPRGEVQVHLAQDDDELNIRIEASRDSAQASAPERPPADIAMPAGILRLHGGAVQLDDRDPHRRRIGLRLPLVSCGQSAMEARR